MTQQATLTGHVSLVTAASSGIGAGVARTLAGAGATVVVAARRADRLSSLVAEIVAAGGTAHALALDVSGANAADVVRDADRRFGPLQSVVNSAGVLLSAKTADSDIADWQAMFAINALGLMTVTHAAFALMAAREHGHVVNISSVSARLASAGSPAYAATKSAVNTFSESLRKEGAPLGVRVTVVSPGIVATELFDHIVDPATRNRFAGMLDAMTPLTPEDIGSAVLFALAAPPHVGINEIVIRPTQQLE